MLNYLETLAPSAQVEVVSVRDDLIRLYGRRGYKEIKRFPLTVFIPPSQITRPDVEFILMEKGPDKS